mgnify:CR=1 FL=1
MATFTISFKLDTLSYQEDILTKRFEIARLMHNAVLNVGYKRYKELTKTKAWRENQANISAINALSLDDEERKKRLKPYYKIKSNLLKEYKLSEHELHKVVSPMQRHFKKNIDSFTAQKIASRAWASFDKLLFGNGETVHFKSKNIGINSVEGKSNKTGIMYKKDENLLKWLGLEIKPKVNLNNQYECQALEAEICYVRIKRKFIRGKYKYYMELVLKGAYPNKIDKNTGETKYKLGSGTLGIDIGTQTIAYVSDINTKLLELAPKVKNIEKEKRKILRYMDRSRRANNPDNYNKDGTIKRGIKLKWNNSKRYEKARSKLKDLYRRQKDIRRLEHNRLANEIISQADTVYVEEMNFKALQKKAKKTTVNKKTGRFNKKKRFGKSLGNKAPAMLIEIIDYKINYKGGKLYKINTKEVKASQYNHLDGSYEKKKLSQRWNNFSYNGKEIKVQRDLYSAFLIKNVTDDLCKVDDNKCNKSFDEFLKLHDKEINRLKGKKNLSSMGV